VLGSGGARRLSSWFLFIARFVEVVSDVHLLLHVHDSTCRLISDLEDGKVLVWIVLIDVFWDHLNSRVEAILAKRFELLLLRLHEFGGRNLRHSIALVLLHLSLFKLSIELLLLNDSLLSLDHIFLLLVVEVSEGGQNEDKSQKNNGDHNNDPGCGAVTNSLDLDDCWIKFILLRDLLDRHVLVDSLLFKDGLDVWSEDRLSSGNSVDVLDVLDDSVGFGGGDDDWVITLGRYGTI